MILWLEVLQWEAIVLIGILVVGVLYLVTGIQRRLGPDNGAVVPEDGLAIGATAPEFTAEDRRTGRSVSLSDYRRQRVCWPSCHRHADHAGSWCRT